MTEPSKPSGQSMRGWLWLLVPAAFGAAIWWSQGEDDYGDPRAPWLAPMLVMALICGVLGSILGGSKRMGASAGFWWGVLLGPVGLLIVAVSESDRPTTVIVQGNTTAPAPPGTPPGWRPDPTQRFTHRYWDGARWTEHVHDGTAQGVDPV